MSNDAIMTRELATALWSYDPETGVFTWKVRAHVHLSIGDAAGCLNNRGRLMLKFKGNAFQGSRIAWLIMTGSWPSREVDHEDGDQSNNKWSNLRLATHGQNCQNQKLRKDNSLGMKGVYPRENGKFRAAISFEGKKYNLGTFDSAEDAKASYDAAAIEFHKEFRRAA
jgi:hypothetical protein